MSAPIYHKEKIIAAISLSGPKTRLEHKGIKMIEDELKLSCELVTNLIEYLDSDSLI